MEFYRQIPCEAFSMIKEITYVNVVLASISIFLVFAHIAELTESRVVTIMTLGSAFVMIYAALVLLFTYEEDIFTPVTDVLIRICCSLQMCGIFYRLCTQNLDLVALVCSVASAALLGLITAYSHHLEQQYLHQHADHSRIYLKHETV